MKANTNPLTTNHFSRLTTTGPAPLYFELQWFLRDEIYMGNFSGPLDAPAFFQTGYHYAYTNSDGVRRSLPGLDVFDGRMA